MILLQFLLFSLASFPPSLSCAHILTCTHVYTRIDIYTCTCSSDSKGDAGESLNGNMIERSEQETHAVTGDRAGERAGGEWPREEGKCRLKMRGRKRVNRNTWRKMRSKQRIKQEDGT